MNSPEVAAQVQAQAGAVNVILEAVTSVKDGDPVTYAIRTDPLPSSTQETQPTQPGSDQNSDHTSDNSASDTDTQ